MLYTKQIKTEGQLCTVRDSSRRLWRNKGIVELLARYNNRSGTGQVLQAYLSLI